MKRYTKDFFAVLLFNTSIESITIVLLMQFYIFLYYLNVKQK